MKPWSHKLLETAVAVFAAAWLVSAAWRMVSPLLPAVVFGVAVAAFLRRQRR